jgi:D-alanyl-D-alanine carboxypeptidase (penicillin-binding protein 5/6)
MTLIVALEQGSLDQLVTVGRTGATNRGGVCLGLSVGAVLPLKDLLLAMMLISANDAAWAVAEHIAGSGDAFAALMTEKARRLGAVDTRFVNPDGNHCSEHYTTARDLAVITAQGLALPEFADIVSTRQALLTALDGRPARELYNDNKLLWLVDGCDGVKTGYTREAGSCLAVSASRDFDRFVGIILDSRRVWGDGAALLKRTGVLAE